MTRMMMTIRRSYGYLSNLRLQKQMKKRTGGGLSSYCLGTPLSLKSLYMLYSPLVPAISFRGK